MSLLQIVLERTKTLPVSQLWEQWEILETRKHKLYKTILNSNTKAFLVKLDALEAWQECIWNELADRLDKRLPIRDLLDIIYKGDSITIH